MDSLWYKRIFGFLDLILSYFIALSRLVVWVVLFFFSGLQRTLFMRSEIVCVEFKTIPLKCDREDTGEKLAYLDKLCSENPDLAEYYSEDEKELIEDEDSDIIEDDTDDEDDGEED